jgi:hypothetical protein
VSRCGGRAATAMRSPSGLERAWRQGATVRTRTRSCSGCSNCGAFADATISTRGRSRHRGPFGVDGPGG